MTPGRSRNLTDVADADALAEGNFAGVRLLLRREDGEECGFAGAVRADEADAIALVNCEGNVVERGVAPKRLEIFCAIRIGGIFSVYGEFE